MRIVRKSAFWLIILGSGVFWVLLLDLLVSIGPLTPHGYSNIVEYDANKLCDLVKPGMETPQVKSLIFSLGKPNQIEYDKAEKQDIDFARSFLDRHGRSNDRLVSSDVAGAVTEPNILIYPNNRFAVGSNYELCDIQMDTAGRKVLSVTTSGSGGIE